MPDNSYPLRADFEAAVKQDMEAMLNG